jgi:hypothetical protein
MQQLVTHLIRHACDNIKDNMFRVIPVITDDLIDVAKVSVSLSLPHSLMGLEAALAYRRLPLFDIHECCLGGAKQTLAYFRSISLTGDTIS